MTPVPAENQAHPDNPEVQAPAAQELTTAMRQQVEEQVRKQFEKLGIGKTAATHAEPAKHEEKPHATEAPKGHAEQPAGHSEQAAGHDHAEPSKEAKVSTSSRPSRLRAYSSGLWGTVRDTLSWETNKRRATKAWNVATWPLRATVWTGRQGVALGFDIATLTLARRVYEKRKTILSWLKGGEETAKAKGLLAKIKAYAFNPGRAASGLALALNPAVAPLAAGVLSLALIIGAGRDMIKPGSFPGISPKSVAAKVDKPGNGKE